MAKSSTAPILTKLFTPMMRSYAGGCAFLGIITTSGLKLATLECENSGNITSISPTFVVSKIPFEVRHFCGAFLSLNGIYDFVPSCTNTRSPSEPLSSNTRRIRFFFLLWLFKMAGTEVANPVPMTTLFLLLE